MVMKLGNVIISQLRDMFFFAGCELWVQEGKTDKISNPCKFAFDALCGTEKYQIYDHEFCKDKK